MKMVLVAEYKLKELERDKKRLDWVCTHICNGAWFDKLLRSTARPLKESIDLQIRMER